MEAQCTPTTTGVVLRAESKALGSMLPRNHEGCWFYVLWLCVWMCVRECSPATDTGTRVQHERNRIVAFYTPR